MGRVDGEGEGGWGGDGAAVGGCWRHGLLTLPSFVTQMPFSDMPDEKVVQMLARAAMSADKEEILLAPPPR